MDLFEIDLPDQKLSARFERVVLKFKRPAGTSRGVLLEKPTFILYVKSNKTGAVGIGECSPLWGLSIDSKAQYEGVLKALCKDINNYKAWFADRLVDFPSIYFGLEMALKDLEQGGKQILFPSNFTSGDDSLKINGLIWMGKMSYMLEQIEEKLDDGFNCIKLKVGALDFQSELLILKAIRREYTPEQLEIRLDANGAFSPDEAMEKLEALNQYHIHSIEQPIKQGNWQELSKLCVTSPIPIALDEELIGIFGAHRKLELLETIKPQYVILKPSLLGGFAQTEEWIGIAESLNIKWWLTSALESNHGLNAIAQFAYITGNKMPQGLGTGSLFENNTTSYHELNGDTFSFKSAQLA